MDESRSFSCYKTSNVEHVSIIAITLPNSFGCYWCASCKIMIFSRHSNWVVITENLKPIGFLSSDLMFLRSKWSTSLHPLAGWHELSDLSYSHVVRIILQTHQCDLLSLHVSKSFTLQYLPDFLMLAHWLINFLSWCSFKNVFKWKWNAFSYIDTVAHNFHVCQTVTVFVKTVIAVSNFLAFSDVQVVAQQLILIWSADFAFYTSAVNCRKFQLSGECEFFYIRRCQVIRKRRQ